MCRYAMTIYKPHYACFECRKTFKRRLLSDIKKGTKVSIAAKCPECGNLTADMGLDFESPRKDDYKSWEHMKNLYTVGETFHSCGCSGPGYIPKSFEQHLELLLNKRRSHIANLQFWLSRKEATIEEGVARESKETSKIRSQISYRLQSKKGCAKTQNSVDFWNKKLIDLEIKIELLSKQKK